MSCSAHLFLQRNLMPESYEHAELTIPAGETRDINLRIFDNVSNRFTFYAVVTAADGACLYSNSYAWGPPREARWDIHQKPKLPVDFHFAYYPTLQKMRLQADLSNLPADAVVEAIDFTIRQRGCAEAVKTARFAGALDQELAIDLPPLAGEYEIVAEARGVNIPTEPVVKYFARNVYEWENQHLGKSRKVYPPFTPIKVQGNTLYTALKEYDLNEWGLFDQVRCIDQQHLANKALLAAPMRYVAMVGGQAVESRAGTLAISSIADDQVVAESEFALGELKINSRRHAGLRRHAARRSHAAADGGAGAVP